MIPKSNLYKGTKVDAVKTMIEVSKLLAKFSITEKRMTQQGSENSFFEFVIHRDNAVSLLIKIKIPMIEKGSEYNREYDEARSFRYFFHYLKALLSAKETELYSIEEIFMAHIVMPLPSGETITMGEQLTRQLESGKAPALKGFDVVAAPHERALEHKKNLLKKAEVDEN